LRGANSSLKMAATVAETSGGAMSSSRHARSSAPKASLLLALPLLALSGGAALADAIDGDWCHGDGRRLSINGPDIVTPGGAHLKGDYDRHHFSYVVPASEPGAGATVAMVLLSEILMRLKPPAGDEQTWRRCGKPIS
jgi:hypothetical protein